VITDEQKKAFEARATMPPQAPAIHASAIAARNGDRVALTEIACALVHCAFAAPETARAVYAALRSGWLGQGDFPAMPAVAPAPLSPDFWNAFWELKRDRDDGPMDALAITSRIAALGAFMDSTLRARAEAIAALHPKAGKPATRPTPPRASRDELARQPKRLAHDSGARSSTTISIWRCSIAKR
jgi:hypothetical protein